MSDPDPIVVVGGGIAGLTAAATLTRAGRAVLLLEQNHQVGGLMAGIWREGFYFDTGDMSHENGGIVFPLMRLFGLFERHQWQRVRYRLKGPDFDFPVRDWDQVIGELAAAFPHERPGIEKLFAAYRRIGASLGRVFRTGSIPYVFQGTERLRAWPRYLQSFLRNGPRLFWASRFRADRLIHKHVADPRLRNFLESAGYPGQAAIVAAFFWHLWINDYWYPRIGLQAMLDSLADYITAHGGRIRCQTRVTQLRIENGRIRGVRTAAGREIPADTVIYTGDIKHLFCGILKDEPRVAPLRARYDAAVLTYPLLSIFAGLSIPPEELAGILGAHHTFYFPSYRLVERLDGNDPDMHEGSWIEISAPSLSNPELAPPGCASVIIQCLSDYHYQNGWALGSTPLDRPEPRRSPAYRRLKQTVKERILKRAEAVIPRLRDRLVYSDIGSPRSTRRFTMNTQGASSGWSWDPRRTPVGFLDWRFTTPIRGLWTAGQYTMWPGCVPSAALSAKIVADRILRRTS